MYFLTQADVLKWKVVRPLSGCSDFRFPHPAGTRAVQTVITHFELVYYPNRHYDCVVSVCGDRGVPTIILWRSTRLLMKFCDSVMIRL